VSNSEDVQYWADAGTAWKFLAPELVLPFTFRVEGELYDDSQFFGLFGPIISGPNRMLSLTCNILQRDVADWNKVLSCTANFKIGPTKARRNQEFEPTEDFDWPWYNHPESTSLDGYPRYCRFGVIEAV